MHIYFQLERHLETLCLTGKQRDLSKGVILSSLNFVQQPDCIGMFIILY